MGELIKVGAISLSNKPRGKKMSKKANHGKFGTGFQYAWCIQVLITEARMARHVNSKHPDKVEESIHEGGEKR
jgi:hypothetical protein